MKKYYFILAAAALGFASCSNDETIESAALSESNEISFRGIMEGVTRTTATVSDGSSLVENGFWAQAYSAGTTTSYFTADHFITNNSGTSYTGTTTHYWPASGNLDFVAWYPNVDGTQLSRSDKAFTLVPAKYASATNPTHTDWLVAGTFAQGKTASGVPLKFKHLGAWVEVKVYNSKGNTAGNLKTTVSGWKIGYLYDGGVFTLNGSTDMSNALTNAGSWSYSGYNQTNTNVPNEYKVVLGSDVVIDCDKADGDHDASNQSVLLDNGLIIVPQTTTKMNSSSQYGTGGYLPGAFIAIKLLIEDGSGNDLAAATSDNLWAVWPITNDLVAGYKYTYTIDLSQGGYKETGTANNSLVKWFENAEIYFANVEVSSWTETAGSNPFPAPAPAP